MHSLRACAAIVLGFVAASSAQNLVLTNDDGWAVANIRAQYDALTTAGFDVVLSAPAENESGTGSSIETPEPLTEPCEFDTCPTGSPAEGFNASDTHLNYVNGYPVDAVKYGIQTLAPQFFGGAPDFVVSGPNLGSNRGKGILNSGTVGAACEASLEGIPSIAVSGHSGDHVSYTTLESDPDSTTSIGAVTFGALTTHLVSTILSSGGTPVLPAGVFLNVNYPSAKNCPDVDGYSWVFTRLRHDDTAPDVETCGSTTLPYEKEVAAATGCWASVSVVNATTKLDVDADTQAAVLPVVQGLPLSCLTSS